VPTAEVEHPQLPERAHSPYNGYKSTDAPRRFRRNSRGARTLTTITYGQEKPGKMYAAMIYIGRMRVG